jgi:hypothetical protein
MTVLGSAAGLLHCYNNRPTRTVTLSIKEKMIENFGDGGPDVKNGKTFNAKIELFERLDTDEHIKDKLLRYLDYFGEHPYNINEKELYVILDSKVNKIEKGHVVLDHPIVTFTEGQIPRNTYHNTLAFRLSIGLNRVDN